MLSSSRLAGLIIRSSLLGQGERVIAFHPRLVVKFTVAVFLDD